MTDKPDEIDELINNVCMHSVVKDGVQTIVYEGLSPKDLKSQLLALKSKWEAEAYKKGYIDSGINQLTTNGDKDEDTSN